MAAGRGLPGWPRDIGRCPAGLRKFKVRNLDAWVLWGDAHSGGGGQLVQPRPCLQDVGHCWILQRFSECLGWHARDVKGGSASLIVGMQDRCTYYCIQARRGPGGHRRSHARLLGSPAEDGKHDR